VIEVVIEQDKLLIGMPLDQIEMMQTRFCEEKGLFFDPLVEINNMVIFQCLLTVFLVDKSFVQKNKEICY
jgi:hypothetical protein